MLRYLIFLVCFLTSVFVEAKTIRIAVLDSGLNVRNKEDVKLCTTGHFDVTDTGFIDNIGHGTNVAHIIAEKLKDVDYCIIVVKIFDPKSQLRALPSTEIALLYLLHLEKLDFVNYSAGGPGYQYAESILIKAITFMGTSFVAAAGNEGKDLDKQCNYYPACYPNVISVGNLETEKKKNITSNYGKKVVSWELGTNVCAGGVCLTGTSQATAAHTAKLVKEMAQKEKKK